MTTKELLNSYPDNILVPDQWRVRIWPWYFLGGIADTEPNQWIVKWYQSQFHIGVITQACPNFICWIKGMAKQLRPAVGPDIEPLHYGMGG